MEQGFRFQVYGSGFVSGFSFSKSEHARKSAFLVESLRYSQVACSCIALSRIKSNSPDIFSLNSFAIFRSSRRCGRQQCP